MTLTRAQFQALVGQIQQQAQPMREALLQFHLMTDGPRPMEPARAAALVSRIRSAMPEAIAEAQQRLQLLEHTPASRPLTGRQFDRVYRLDDPPPVANPPRWRLPAHRTPPLQPDARDLMNREPLQVWVERGVAPDWLPAATVAAAYARLFGIGPPRATWTREASSPKGYTPREIQLLLTALSLQTD
jgi:hypothetical protein